MCAYSLSETAMDDTPLPITSLNIREHSDDDLAMSPSPPPHSPHSQHPTPSIPFFLKAIPSSSPQSLFTPPTTPPPSIFATSQTTAFAGLPPLQVECVVRARLPLTEGGEFFLHQYTNNRDNKNHLALVWGDDLYSRSLYAPRQGETEMDRVVRGAYTGRLRQIVTGEGAPLKNAQHMLQEQYARPPVPTQPILVRIHSECYTGEVVHSGRCECGEQLDESIRLIQMEGRGVIVYLKQEGRNIGLLDKLKSYNLQDLGYDTMNANILLHHAPDERTYGEAVAILADLGISQIRLLTNNPNKIEQIESNGTVRVVERVPMVPRAWANKQGRSKHNQKELHAYLKTKVQRMGHIIQMPKDLV